MRPTICKQLVLYLIYAILCPFISKSDSSAVDRSSHFTSHPLKPHLWSYASHTKSMVSNKNRGNFSYLLMWPVFLLHNQLNFCYDIMEKYFPINPIIGILTSHLKFAAWESCMNLRVVTQLRTGVLHVQ